ncbi:MAG: hypothetical protein LC808_44500, partial [Actinobacteria bacterium]|nr:hypothetical protein [Actinomycetota bacterium]
PLAPEAAPNVAAAVAAAPPEEAEQAELIATMSSETPPEAQADILPDQPQERSLDKKLNQEIPDEGAAPGEAIAQLDAEELPVTEVAEPGGETLDPGDPTGEESIESIVQDMKRERGQD